MPKTKLITLLIFLQTSFLGFAQTITVEGKITAFNKYPLANIEVKAKKSKAISTTNTNGIFSIEIKKKDVLSIRNPLFHLYEEKVSEKTGVLSINLFFDENDENVKKAIEKGYFTEADLNYALENMGRENNIFSLFNDVYEAIKYAIPEASMVEKNGSVGFILRGTNSIHGSNKAIYVVNKNVVGDISYIIPSEIRKIWKLPTSQSAMYGSRAGNGVICIETF